MKKTICYAVLMALIADGAMAGPLLDSGLRQATQAGNTCYADEQQGRVAAGDQHGTVGWLLGGVAAGLVGGVIGMGVMGVASGVSGAQPKADSIPGGVDVPCYRRGYKSKAKHKNVVASLLGSGIGTAIWMAVYFSNQNDF